MLAYTLGLPLSIFVFLIVGALVGTHAPDPGAGLMPGFIAGIIVFGLCLQGQRKVNVALESPDTITVDCSPERAFSAVHECLMLSNHGPNYWSTQPLQNSLRIIGTLKFDESLDSGEKSKSLKRHVRLLASVRTNAAGKTVVKLAYTVHSDLDRWACDEIIAKTTTAIRRELMCA